MSEQEIEKKSQDKETGLATIGETAVATAAAPAMDFNDAFGESFGNTALAEITGDIDSLLKQMSVTEFTGAKAMIGHFLTLLDAFPFTMSEESKQQPGVMLDVAKVIYEVADEHGEVKHVMQNANPSRERFITLYQKVKAANTQARTTKKLSITNVQFVEVGQPKFGNKPIVLTFSPESQSLLTD